ncbi:hypothetical protein KY336_00295 [Candidatus Woesearchaeota archaeon]|nr:hypothetical protein [Candidatus Woesearchaeota archaeon]
MKKPGIVQRIAEIPFTPLYIGTYLLRTALFGEDKQYKDDTSREFERELIRAYIANNELSEPAQERFWAAYHRLQEQPATEYNLAALANRFASNIPKLAEHISNATTAIYPDLATLASIVLYPARNPKKFFSALLHPRRTINNFLSEDGIKPKKEIKETESPGMELAKEFVHKDINRESSQRFAEHMLSKFEDRLYGLTVEQSNPGDEKNQTLVEKKVKITDRGHYDALSVAIYLAVEDTVKELGEKLGFEYKNDPWFNIFTVLGDKNLLDYVVRGDIGGRWLDHQGARDMLLDRHEHLEIIAQRTADPDACKDLLSTVSKEIRSKLVDRLTGFSPADLNGQLNADYLSGLVKAYEEYVKRCCTETNGKLGRDLLAISQYIRLQLYDYAIDLFLSKDPEKKKNLPKLKSIYKNFCLNLMHILQEEMPDQEFETIVQEDVDDLEKRAVPVRDELITRIVDRIEKDHNTPLAELFIKFVREGHYKKGMLFPTYVIDNAPVVDMDFTDLDTLIEHGTLDEIAKDGIARMAAEDGGIFSDVAGPEPDGISEFLPEFFHPETGEQISREELLAYYENLEKADSE